MITFGNTSIQISLIAVLLAFFVVKLLFVTVGIWFVVQGFRVHWGWGLANLLIPGAVIPFCVLHFKESKKPMILAGVCLALMLIFQVCARHGSHSHSKVDVGPDLPASVTSAVLHLNLVSASETISGGISLKTPVFHDDFSKDNYDEERLTAIKSVGFMVRFITCKGAKAQTNFVLFPFEQTTETNALGWRIIGNYSDNIKAWPIKSPRPAGNNIFHLLTTNGFITPSVGGESSLRGAF